MRDWFRDHAHAVTTKTDGILYSVCLDGDEVVHPQDEWNNELNIFIDNNGTVRFSIRQVNLKTVKSVQSRYRRFGVKRDDNSN